MTGFGGPAPAWGRRQRPWLSFLLKRTGFAAVTLVLLSVVIFAGGHVLPGDVGRSILGPLADARAVTALDHALGADRPWPALYARWAGGLLRGDMGRSYAYRVAVAPVVLAALLRSLALAGVALAMVVPAAIGAGVYAAYREGRWQDKAVTLLGLSLTAVPEFVSGIVFILVLGVMLRVLPITAEAPAGSGFLARVAHLIMPALPLVLILFGYIARIARAGTIEARRADYVRTAMLKGLAPRVIIVRHVLRNALLPAITVIAGQTSYLIGGLVVVETLFRWPGLGSLILRAAHGKDYPMLEGGILTAGAVFVAATLLGDVVIALLDPRRLEAA